MLAQSIQDGLENLSTIALTRTEKRLFRKRPRDIQRYLTLISLIPSLALDSLVQRAALLVVHLLVRSILDQAQPLHRVATEQILAFVDDQLAVAVRERLSAPNERRRLLIEATNTLMPVCTSSPYRSSCLSAGRPGASHAHKHGTRVRGSAIDRSTLILLPELRHDHVSSNHIGEHLALA